ncbi:MAG: MFS transporter [Caldilineaceae bacterium]|nr:MFS transporter [Caldilineaceae bacterium]
MKARISFSGLRSPKAMWGRATAAPPPRIEDAALPVPRHVARRILIGLMLPSMLMPLTSSMADVALPTIRDQFAIRADMTAWVSTAFTLPFMVLMPVYGRLSDGVGKRRLILAGLLLFALGTMIVLSATNLGWLMLGRAIQGIGSAGIMPLSIAFITAVFHPKERGEALGAWSSVGPLVGFLAPLGAGFVVEFWGWRAAFAPPLLFTVLTVVVVAQFVPAGLSRVMPHFWRRFDWMGVLLLTAAVISFIFFVSSRPITGVAPLQDWRLLGASLLLFAIFIRWERRHENPFVLLGLFRRGMFTRASFCASMRMVTMSGGSFLLPLFLVDVYGLTPTTLGGMLMIIPGAMALVVRYGGQMADRWGSRVPIVMGGVVQMITMLILSQLPAQASLGWLILVLAGHGFGVGLMLAPLHHAAMRQISDGEMGTAAGLYSMVRFAGSAVGTALIGVLLQFFLDQGLPTVNAYQNAYLFLAGIALLGLIAGIGLNKAATVPGQVAE